MKILFIQPPHNFDGKERRAGFFPVGLGYMTNRLLEEDHEVEVLDIWANPISKEELVGGI